MVGLLKFILKLAILFFYKLYQNLILKYYNSQNYFTFLFYLSL